jgi:phage protein D
MKNTLPTVSAARTPRGVVTVNGQRVPWLSWSVESNVFYAADTFRVTIPVSGLPAGYGPDYFLAQPVLTIQVYAGFPNDPNVYAAGDLPQLFYGVADDITWDLGGTVIEIAGRDLTGALIDTKTVNKYQNQTASQIATIIAGNHGLAPVVTATTIPVGRYYKQDNVRLQDDRTEWDLLCWLAREAGFVVFVDGQSLYFQPQAPITQDPYVFQYRPPVNGPAQFNATRIRLQHNKTLAKDIKVVVRTWGRNAKQVITVSASASHIKSTTTNAKLQIPTGQVTTYTYTIPFLTAADAQRKANQIARELSAHELKLEIDGPADALLQRTDLIKLAGTGTLADTVFFPCAITRSMSFAEGYIWRIEAKNHPGESTPAI